MDYTVQITEVLQKIIKVTADSEDSAVDKVLDCYYDGGIILDSSDCVSHDVEIFK